MGLRSGVDDSATTPELLCEPAAHRPFGGFRTLRAGASASVSIDVVTDASRADDTLPYVNTARVTTSTYEQDTSDNADTETTPVVPA